MSEIVLKEKTLQEEKTKRGENYNVFRILGLQTSEVRMHSAFIAELLNPNGDHGLGDKFLQVFIQDVIKKNDSFFIFDPKSAKVAVEYNIGELSEDGERGGRIDLIIRDNDGQTIIIENKIYADDQHRQLSRYFKYAKEDLKLADEKIKLIYLALKVGDAPSKDSLGNDVFDYTCISYESEILSWLKKCLAISALFPIVRETIRQYILNLNNIIPTMENNEELLKTILDSETNLRTALAVMNSGLRKRIINDFIEELRELAKEEGMEFDAKPRFADLAPRCYATVSFWLKDYPCARFTIQQGSTEVWYGIDTTGNPKEIKLIQLYDDPSSIIWPHGNSYFKGVYRWWDTNESLFDLKFGHEIYDYIKSELEKARPYLKELHKAIESTMN